ncbi:hypothetical protein CEE37_14715 [candidate division LCP-89 bacterium B3_LCP]|uniref:LTD domain-containing protein n=1 Tax=candidate division LCP-89 bacterium B3_LCP TaxID=2012998 RepID=A0A532UPG9_UNCL8|nr:MAG: hypothetical protein CEE37_14715 [candidate division LCP-89 bacterium B3_LCP]
MKRNLKTAFIYVLLTLCICNVSDAVQYEPPINIVFMVHVEPLDFPGTYANRIAFLEWLQQEALSRPNPFKLTILMNGEFAEYAYYNGDQPFLEQLENEGHELGTHAHTMVQLAPFTWLDVDEQTHRYGIPIYNGPITEQTWSDAKYWVDSLTTNNHTFCGTAFLCSTEGQMMTSNNFLCGPGNRSEKGPDYLGHLLRHPFRPASDNRLGHEIEEDLNSSFIYIDHFAQIGYENAHGYNCSAPALAAAMDECYQDWLAAEIIQGDSLEHKVWTFGFLTHLWLYEQYFEQQITLLLNYMDSHYVGQYTPRGNLIARYATCNEVTNEFIAWEASHPGESSFSYIHPYPQEPLLNEAMIIPEDFLNGSEWIEIYNPTDQWIDVSGYEIYSGELEYTDFWRFPPQCYLGPYEYLIAAGNGMFFLDRYGLRPDFEIAGGSGARELYSEGYYTLHNNRDGCVITNTDSIPINTNTAITDGLSWGEDYVAGFTLSQPVAGETYGRDAYSTDTGYGNDWSLNGGAVAPTPGGANSANYFNPEIFARVDPDWSPMQVDPWGGTVHCTATLGNEYPYVQPIDVWTNVVLPNGNLYGPLILRENRNLAPSDSFSVNISQYVPENAPSGHYRYNLYIGDYPSNPTTWGYFYFEKLGYTDGDDFELPEPDFSCLDGKLSESATADLETPSFHMHASPNPFNQTTAINFALPVNSDVKLKVFDVSGRLVMQKSMNGLPAGGHLHHLDGSNLSSGVYIVALEAGNLSTRSKILLLK